ncbi:MarR family transcriptional regulator [Kribbella sp. NBC_01245]|uniref:MarR family winged helix-turn-helix transcriptional regulator n=1 Tax=Kribbella sp. NBC_01245 TaxID=2903578 RepID=UPI002E2A1000|nr:MarR family transcriptional regulator [Kribbella sp. NBC_01245]
MKDFVDAHIELWRDEQEGIDARVEGIAVRMQVLVRHLDRQREAALSAHNLPHWGFKTLHMLRRGGAPYRATPGELAKHLSLSPATLTSRLDAMERAGYLRRDHDRDDRRRVLVTLTREGHKIWERTIEDQQKVEQDLIRHLPAKDQDLLNNLLRRLVLATDA